MIKRFLVFIFIYFFITVLPHTNSNIWISRPFILKACAQEVLKINSINFDNSDSIIFLGTSGGSEDIESFNITKKILTEPDRVLFDIENAVITFPNSTYELKNSRLTQVKIAQNTTNPDVVRIVIQNSKNYDTSKIKVYKIKNNIIIKLSNETPLQQYSTQIYKETKSSSVEYYDKTVVIPEEKQTTTSDEILNQVQQAFKTDDKNELVRPNIEQKQARLKSRFFLSNAEVKSGNLLLSGIGVVNIEKPFTLTEPSRIIFDMPNTIVAQELREKEIRLSETDSAKIGQFTPSKARIVIKTVNPQAYLPVYSSTLQTILIANKNKLLNTYLTKSSTELTYFKEQNINSETDVINITFSNPVIYSIQKTAGKINLTIYNLLNFNTESFNALALKNKTGFEAKQSSSHIYTLSFPADVNTFVDCYETLNAAQLRLVFTHKIPPVSVVEPKQTPQTNVYTSPVKKEQTINESPFADLLARQKRDSNIQTQKKTAKKKKQVINKIKNKVIIIDPGHGGSDTGAMRGKTLEKDLTLQIALKVREQLRERGFNKIIMTRTGDTTVSLAQRVETANNNNADIYVSIHINASVKSEIKGIETHYYSESGYQVAKIMHKELMSKVDAADRGLFKSKFYVINHTEAPAVLLELGFISNESERNGLVSEKRQTESAEAIAEGIINYLTEH